MRIEQKRVKRSFRDCLKREKEIIVQMMRKRVPIYSYHREHYWKNYSKSQLDKRGWLFRKKIPSKYRSKYEIESKIVQHLQSFLTVTRVFLYN